MRITAMFLAATLLPLAHGCSGLGPAAPTPQCGCTDADGNPAPLPTRLYAGAIDKARDEARPEEAIEWLRRSFAAGFPRPSLVLTDPAFDSVRRDATLRPRLRNLLREHARESHVIMAGRAEPGERIVVAGTVTDASGARIVGALVYIFHTDHTGRYNDGGMDETNPRLFAFLRTDDRGRFEYQTIRPGHYPIDPNPAPDEGRGSDGVEQHIHYEVSAAGFEARQSRLGFADDPFWRRTGLQVPRWAAAPSRAPDGAVHFEHRITLRP